jgi:ABC-type dipeptide/oligopeptide/nickel transport system ATPase component
MSDLRVEHLAVELRTPQRTMPILKDVSISIPAGRSVALVGESGAGKSMTAYAIMRLFPVESMVIAAGRILYGDVDLAQLPEEELRAYRGAQIAIVFQEPSAALNPIMSVGSQVMESVEVHFGRRGARERALEAFRRVGLDPSLFGRYPHHLSGGQRQRVLIASAIAPLPKLLIADEPTSGLDVTVQAQILDLLHNIQKEMGMSLLLITHNLGLVAERTDDVYVLRRGEIVESGPTPQVFRSPEHPYTRALLRIAPTL